MDISLMVNSHVVFSSNVTREKEILELIHSDLFGLVSLQSLGGSQYYISFIGDFFVVTWFFYYYEEIWGLWGVSRVEISYRKSDLMKDQGVKNY